MCDTSSSEGENFFTPPAVALGALGAYSRISNSNNNNNKMDLDLEEYDQVEEIKFIVDHGNAVGGGQVYCESGAMGNANSSFVVSLSSCSDQASLDESDFIFIPDLVQKKSQPDEPVVTCKPAVGLPPSTGTLAVPVSDSTNHHQQQQQQQIADTRLRYHRSNQQQQPQPLAAGEPRSANIYHQQVLPNSSLQHNGNPFQRCLAVDTSRQQSTTLFQLVQPAGARLETPDKPVGPLRPNPKGTTDPSKLTGLMQQIVTRSDSILIVIPCSYCNQSISCQPSDVTSWLRHMDGQHNCRVCPICAKLIGLGFARDINIMKRHVLEHIDDKWLSNQPTKTNFTFGLQQHWFSEIGCAVRDLRNK